MKCGQARRLFGTYWDDETTQAEREWLESHLASCRSCRHEYETLSRTLELAGSLPRVEPAPDLLERVLSRTRRAAPVPDRFPSPTPRWIPITAAAALLALAASLVVPWLGLAPRSRHGGEPAPAVALREPERVSPVAVRSAPPAVARASGPSAAVPPTLVASNAGSAIPDSLFDHSEDIEFILDPVTLRRGRATVTRLPGGVQGEKAVISF